MSPKLYELAATYRQVEALAEQEGEWLTALGNLKELAEDKLENIGKLWKEWATEKAAIEDHLKDTQEKLVTLSRRMESLREYARIEMELMGIAKVKRPLVSLRLQNSPLAVEVLNEAIVPSTFKRATLILPLDQVPEELVYQAQVAVNKALVLEEAKAGNEVQGTAIVRRQHLRIE